MEGGSVRFGLGGVYSSTRIAEMLQRQKNQLVTFSGIFMIGLSYTDKSHFQCNIETSQ